jgi:S1-C subfamily serine protease
VIVPQLIQHGKVIRPGLGIGIVPDNMKKRIIGEGKGIIVSYVDDKGSAAKAGIKGMTQDQFGRTYLGDIILNVDGQDVNTQDDIYQILDKHRIGDEIMVKYRREGKTLAAKIKLQAL